MFAQSCENTELRAPSCCSAGGHPLLLGRAPSLQQWPRDFGEEKAFSAFRDSFICLPARRAFP